MGARRDAQSWSAIVQRKKALNKALFWLGCSAVAEFAQAGLQMDVAFHEPLPSGPKILAANHPTTLDPFLLLALIDEPISILVTGDVFKIPIFGRYLRAAGHIPVIKTDGRPAFQEALALLQMGHTVGIFPEGQLSPFDGDFSIAPARSGVARLALATGAAVVPVGIHLPRDGIRHLKGKIDKTPGVARLIWRGPYAVTVGSPLQYSGDSQDRPLVRSVAGQIMDRIAELQRSSRKRVTTTLSWTVSPSLGSYKVRDCLR